MVKIIEHTKPRSLDTADLRLLNLPPKMWTVKLSMVNDFARPVVEAYLKDRGANMRLGTGMLIKGKEGSGKTSIAAGMLKIANAYGYSGYFTATTSLREAIRHSETFDSDNSMLQHCERVDVLVLDDLTLDDAEDKFFGGHKIRHLIKTRRDWLRPTFVTYSPRSHASTSSVLQDILNIQNAWVEVITSGSEKVEKKSVFD